MTRRSPHGGGGGLVLAHAYLADLSTDAGRPREALERLESLLKSQSYPRERRPLLQPAVLSAARAELALGDLAAAQGYGSAAREMAEYSARGADSSADVGDTLVLLARVEPRQVLDELGS